MGCFAFFRRRENLSLMVANFARRIVRIVVYSFVGFYVYCNWWGNREYMDCCVFFRRIFRWKWGKFLSFFGKRALTITNQFPSSENPIEEKKIFIPFLKIRQMHILVFLTQNRFVLAENPARLLKNTIGTKANRNISLRRKIRRRIKIFFTHPGKRFFGPATLFLSDSVQKIRQ
jgi:hypothetical protein